MLLLARGMEARMLLLARDPLPAPRNTTQSAPGDVDLIILSSPLQGLECRVCAVSNLGCVLCRI